MDNSRSSSRALRGGGFLLATSLVVSVAARADQPPRPFDQIVVVDDDRKECPEAQYTDLRVAAAAAPPGATILVCPGLYPGPVVVTRPLTFLGPARGEARRRDAKDHAREAIVLGGPVGDGFTLAVGSSGTIIDGFVITSAGAQPIFDAGIDVRDPLGAGYQILDNLITRNNVGIYFHSSGGQESRIERNAFVENNAGGFPSPNTGTAIFTQGLPVDDTRIANNLFEGHADSALNLGDGSARGLVIEDNTSVNDSTFLVLGKATGAVVSENRAVGTTQSALYFFGQNRGVLVVGNDLEAGPGNASSGIRLTGPYFGAVGPNAGMSIAHNRARHFGYGIRGSNVVDSDFDQNRLRDNSVDGIQMSPVDTAFAPAAGNTLTGNEARGDGAFDCEDQSKGPGTSGTANFWIDDRGETANPPGICR